MSQTSAIIAKIEAQGFITNGDIMAMDVTWRHTGRNRLTEESTRLYFEGKGLKVSKCKLGKTFSENRWDLIPISGAAQAAEVSTPCPRSMQVENERTCGGRRKEAKSDQQPSPAPLFFKGQAVWPEIVRVA